MSNEVKNKVDMDPKYIIKLTVTLFLTCMVVAGVLGWVNSITKDKIAAITWEKTVTAMKEVISDDDFSDAMDLTDDMTAAATARWLPFIRRSPADSPLATPSMWSPPALRVPSP